MWYSATNQKYPNYSLCKITFSIYRQQKCIIVQQTVLLAHSFLLDYETQHPILLPKSHSFTTALVMHYHQKLLHAGPQCLLSSIRLIYWPIGGRKQIGAIISKYLRCFRMKLILNQHVMGALSPERVKPSKAFQTTGVDFCGPFHFTSKFDHVHQGNATNPFLFFFYKSFASGSRTRFINMFIHICIAAVYCNKSKP